MTAALEEQIAQLLSSSDADRLQAALTTVLRHFAADTGTIHCLDWGDGHLYLLAASDGIPAPVIEITRRIPLGKGIAGEAAQTGKPVTMCNLQGDTSGIARPGAKATGVHGALCVPIWRATQVVGTLGIGCRGDRIFTDAETDQLIAAGRAMALHVALAQR